MNLKLWVMEQDAYGVETKKVRHTGIYLDSIFAPGGVAIGLIDDATGRAIFVDSKVVMFKEPKFEEVKDESGSTGAEQVHGGPSQPTSGSIDGTTGQADSGDGRSLGQVRQSEEGSKHPTSGVQSKGNRRNQHAKGNK